VSPEFLDTSKLDDGHVNVNVKNNVNANLMYINRECLRGHPSQRLMIKSLIIIQIELELENVGF